MVLRMACPTKRKGSDNWYYRRTIPADVRAILLKVAKERREFSMEQRFGGFADGLLTREGIVTDDDSRWRLIEALARDLTEGARKLARNADGNYSPDTYVSRFPSPSETKPSARQANHSLTGLADAWHTGALARGVRPRDAKRWKRVVLRFKDWLTYDDLSRVTPEKVQAWGDELSADGLQAKTINDTNFAALRAVFDWGTKRGWLSSNPAMGARIEGRGKKVTREPYFLENEREAILKAALAVKGTPRENPKTTAAKRWVPWLCAYSGARVAEMIQLRKEDVRKENEAWVIRLTPEAGGIKTNHFRDVPVHEHLISLGFIEFLNVAKAGPLFCDVGKDGTTAGPADGVYSRIRELVRSVVPDRRVQPNHAWRYTFKTYGHEANLNELTLDAICGHAARTKGEDYTKVTLKKRMEAMAAFPRYQIGETARRDTTSISSSQPAM
jgi:integrase